MSSVAAIDPVQPRATVAGESPRAPVIADAQLAKREAELSDWVHCPSSKTPEGKAKIAQISAQIDTLKAQIVKAQDAKKSVEAAVKASASAPSPQPPDRPGTQPAASPRFDALGTWIDLRA